MDAVGGVLQLAVETPLEAATLPPIPGVVVTVIVDEKESTEPVSIETLSSFRRGGMISTCCTRLGMYAYFFFNFLDL